VNSPVNILRSLLVGLLLLPFGTFAADWPQWRGPDRTGHVPEGVAIPTALPVEPKILWRTKIGEGLASPVVAGGRVFYLDNQADLETLHAVAESDARELWRASIDLVFADNQTAPGPRCTPLVDDGRIYAQSCNGELRCLNASDGSPVWSVNYTKDFSAVVIGEKGRAEGASRHGYAGSPVIDGDKLYATVGGTKGDSAVCFQKATGKIIWKSQNDEAAYAAPIVATILGQKQLIVFTADGLIGLDLANGHLLWRTPFKTASARHATTPVVVEDMVLVASYQFGLVGVKISRDGTNWQSAQAWAARDSAMNFASPVAVGGYVYGLGPERNLFCADVKTGRQMWSQAGYISGAPLSDHAAFLVMGGNILVLTDGGELVLFPADAKGFKELGRVQVCGKNWCNPAYSDAKLFLRDGHELMCISVAP
jgi:outer membrane protein assembly factor BamB